MELVHLLKHVQIYLKVLGVKSENIIMCDSKGVIYKGRKNIDQFKSDHAIETKVRTLEDAIKGADVFLGLVCQGCFKRYGKINGKKSNYFCVRKSRPRN